MDGNSLTYVGFDSEFLPTGQTGDPESVHSIQFSDGIKYNFFIESSDDLKRFLNNNHALKEIFGFNMLCDLGAIKEWLPANSVQVVPYRGKLVGKIKYGSCNLKAFDVMPLLLNFGFRRLADVGELVGVPKLDKPSFLGLRKWQTEQEYDTFRNYALNDAVITAKAAQWLIENNACDPRVYASAGSIAAEYFRFPKRHTKAHGRLLMSPIERMIAQSTAAGRNEMFTVGYTPHAYYNDVKSLYPCSIFATSALTINGVVPCEPDDLPISNNLNEQRFGWFVGCFITENKMWGLPINAKQVTYVNGKVIGMFHTFDLAAAKAKPLWIAKAYKPTFSKERTPIQTKFNQMLSDQVEGKLDEKQSRYAKAVLNSTYGKLGQSHPEALTTNYPAFSTILAHSHLTMSLLFDRCPIAILGMDTDSIFSASDMSGKHAELTNGEFNISVVMEVKGKGELASFRAKTYMMHEEGAPIRVYGRHAWHYFIEDYFRLWDNPDFPFTTRIEVKHTLKTKNKAALSLPLGFWSEKPVKLTKDKVSKLLQADLKRARATYDSFYLFENHKNISSEPYLMDDILHDPLFDYPSKSSEKFPFVKVSRFSTS